MQLLSWIWLLFLPVLVGVNFYLPAKQRSLWLLIASCTFICWFSWQAFVLAFVISAINFIIAGRVRSSRSIYYFILLFNIACIVLGNYVVAYGVNVNFQLEEISFDLSTALLILGLSFYTLQHIAYIIDCRRGNQIPEANYFQFLSCAFYFPKFLSGPLTKYEELRNQLDPVTVDGKMLISGFNRLLLGGLTILTAGLLFTLQLYFDFSGYTDMALGVSKMLGIDLSENFNLPLRSLSISEFWRRWHISLIRFFTNYVFYPISYKLRKYISMAASVGIACTFLLSGIWHGLGLSFMLWAVCHLIYLQIELFTRGIRNVNNMLIKIAGWLLAILAVSFSNVFFRSPGYDSVVTNIQKMLDWKNFVPNDFNAEFLAPLAVGGQQWNFFNFYLSLIVAFTFLIFEKRINTQSVKNNFSVLYVTALLIMIFLFGIFNSGEQFIYVQF